MAAWTREFYIYNCGKFRLKYTTEVYYMLFGIIPIYITSITGREYLNRNGKLGRLAYFHKIVSGFKLK